MFLNLIFTLFVLKIIKEIWILIKENKSDKGDKPIKHFGSKGFRW